MEPIQINCFKAYDVRGRIPDEINEEIATRIGLAYAQVIRPDSVIVGRDIRLTSKSLADALCDGLMAGGVDVLDIGLCGTEEVYFSTFDQGAGGGIMVTASHNPMDFNGMKFVREGSRPISGDSGLDEIRRAAEAGAFDTADKKGDVRAIDVAGRFVDHLLAYISAPDLRPLKIVVNAGNGCAGPVIDRLEQRLPFDIVKVHHEPDGSFPNGIPNPLLVENRDATADAVVAAGADLGVAWDGDFDRCFLFDEQGRFIEGYYVVGLLAKAFLDKNPGAKIVHDPRLTWNTIDIVKAAGGMPVQSKTGHAFIKERMRLEDAVYGGEMSAHHYFRDFAYCDSGMIPWLLVAEMISATGMPLSQMLNERMLAFPASGEINRKLEDPAAALALVESRYAATAVRIDRTDGLSVEFDDWRFNLRTSNTEPLVRLNVESRGDTARMESETAKILELLDSSG